MQNALINLNMLQEKTKKGACLDCGGFVSYLPVFLNYSPLLDTHDIAISATMNAIWGSKVEDHLRKAIEFGVLLETKQKGLYLYAPYFAEQAETKIFQRIGQLKAVAASFDLDPSTLWITKARNGEGNLNAFLAIVSSFLSKGKKGEKIIRFAVINWQAKQKEIAPEDLEEGLGNGRSNINCNCGGNGESNAVTITPKESPNDKESAILNEWAKQFMRPLDELDTYIRRIYWEESKPTKEEIESLLERIPQNQCPEKFKDLFKDVLTSEQEKMSLPNDDT